MRVLLILDVPENCYKCHFYRINDFRDEYCSVRNIRILTYPSLNRDKNCPLILTERLTEVKALVFFEMPNHCWDCYMFDGDYIFDKRYCNATGEEVSKHDTDRHEKCPLIPIEIEEGE